MKKNVYAPRRRSGKGPILAVLGTAAACVAVLIGMALVFGQGQQQSDFVDPRAGLVPTAADAEGAGDSAGENGATSNTASAEEAAPVAETVTMTLGGGPETYVLKGEEYLEPGCHAFDANEGDITSSVAIDGSVDTTTPGDYAITYTATLSSGAQAKAVRTVHVVEDFEALSGAAETLPVLMYHYVYTKDDVPDDLNGNYILDTDLAQHLAYLREEGYYYPSYQEVRAFAEGTHTLPAKSVVLTFDDASYWFLDYGVPLLEQYEVPATSFVICNQDEAADKISQYASSWVSFQSHSYALHSRGTSEGKGGIIHAKSAEEIAADLTQAAEFLGANEAFAYPFGDGDEDAVKGLKQAGTLCGFLIENRRIKPGDAPEELPRVRISGDYTQEGFRYLVTPNGGEQ